MSFSGKKFRRVRAENIEELLKVSKANESVASILQSTTPTFSFTRIEDQTFTFHLQAENRQMTVTFTLGQETELERRDGTKVKVTYTLEADNVISQVIKSPDGKISYFRREFGDKEMKMTITIEGSDVAATVYYEQVE
ncbi:unnamed protein product [Chilo suppressalis]|uniref:Lipocalin/cytosolic fatty-acid binding domain-containing protein n=1 Tax=Chilo suppressalis TaxID=168631 RepID=A0ABN8AQG6_CHISP|nr:unnamed protein product [Chilo suppressalis]